MNNADFLSDAVALDLGKSGVKVAETLEIQVGEEWWRLINAADVATVRAYQGRREASPVIVGGEIHLEGAMQYCGHGYPFYRVSDNPPVEMQQRAGVVGIITVGDERTVVYGVLGQKNAASAGGYYGVAGAVTPIFRVERADGTVLGTHNPAATYYYQHQWLFWDSSNSRFVGVTSNLSDYISVLYGLGDGSAFQVSSRISGSFATLRDIRSFLEREGLVYSLFSSGGSLYVRETAIAAGASYTTVGTAAATLDASCVAVASAANHGGKGWLFFSRAFNSVGIVWRDSTANAMKYALMSEGFATAYTFPDLSEGGSKTVESVGNFVVPREGEFLAVSVSSLPSGVLTRPAGWSYPENFAVVGMAEIASGRAVILGTVGTTLYRLEVDLNAMAITKIWSVTTPIAIVRKATLTHLEEGRELYTVIFENRYTRPYQVIVFCLDTVGESLAWCFSSPYDMYGTTTGGDWRDSSLWSTVAYSPKPFFSRLGGQAIFARTGYYNSYVRTEAYVVNMSALAQCSSLAAVKALMTAAGKKTANLTTASTSVHSFNNNIKGGHIEDDAMYYVPRFVTDGSAIKINLLAVRKDTLAMYSATMIDAGTVEQNTGDQYTEILPFSREDGGRDESRWGEYEVSDGCVVLHAHARYVSTSNMGVNAMAVLDSTGYRGRAAYGMNLAGSTSPAARYADASPLGDKRSRIAFLGYGATLAVDGCSWNAGMTAFAAYRDKVALPFSHSYGLVASLTGEYVSISGIVSGDISWAKLDSLGGRTRELVAVRAADLSDLYTIVGLETPGGLPDVRFCGRLITGVTGAGRMMMADLNAGDDEGYGGGGGGTVEGGNVYEYSDRNFTPYPFAREGIRAELSNISKTTKITLPETQDNLIRGMLAAGTDFRGSRCILRRVFPDHIDEPGSDIVLLDGYIQDWSYVPGKKGIAFSVSKTLIDVGAQFPKRLMNMGCSHVFKGSRCQYLGEEGRCLKTRAFCTSLGNLNQFGGFPWVAARQRRVMWK